jgi:tetratricopeptide (TPR) repeat protein
LLLIWTGWFVLRMRQQPYLLTGWLWFLGTLVPTIGLVQFCIQARADRYTYIPSIGLFIVVVWGFNDLFDRWPAQRKLLPVLGGLALAGCLAASSVQIGYWQNSLTVAEHAIEVTDDNYVACESAGEAIAGLGHPESATNLFAQAVHIAPNWPQGQFNYGITLIEVGQTNAAIEHLEAGANLAPDFAPGRSRLGQALLAFGRTDEAVREFAEAMRLQPDDPDIRFDLGHALQQQGKFADAVVQYREALRRKPGLPTAKAALEQILSAHPDLK